MPDTESLTQAPVRRKKFVPGRKRKALRIVLWTVAGLLAAVVVAAGAGVLWLRAAAKAALPVLDGELRVAGLSAPVTVRRDGHGVPHIEAASQEDLWVAQGYVTAQDRLWQMDAFRRNANGELAEVLGSSLIKHDTAQRVLQFRLTARRIYANLSAVDRARLDAYARGVNLFIAQHGDTLPPEFKLLGYRPQAWAGVDSLSIGMMMVQMLDTHWDVKLSRERIAGLLNDPKLEADLYPVGSWRDHPPTGELLDLSQPHPELQPPSADDEEDDRSHAGLEQARPLDRLTSGAEAPGYFGRLAARLKSCPDTSSLSSAACEIPASHAQVSGSSYHAQVSGSSYHAQGSGSSYRAQVSGSSYHAQPEAHAYQSNPGDGAGVSTSGEDTAALREAMGLPACAGCTPGSNNWVIAGKHTASGKPLLSNDMHLGLTEPNIWFMADLSAPGYHAAGVTLPGMPFVIAGHNEHVAWGFTALYADVQDLYIEKLDGKGNYEGNDAAWHALTVDHEVIKVRGGKDVVLEVESTDHGPLLNPLFTKEKRAIALKWTLYDTTLNALPLWEMNTAGNWGEFSAALGKWCWPTQNVVYSDDQGHIGYHAVGKVPTHLGGPWGKPLSRDALNEHYEGQGYIPFDQMPNAFDPPSGLLATANSRVTTEKSPYPLALEWVEPYRAERIYKMLQGRDGLGRADMLAVQTDVYSEVDQELGQRFAYAIDHTPGVDARLKKAADLMRSWDGKLTADSAAASIVTETRRALWPLILEPKLGKDAGEYRWSESNFAEEEIVMHANAQWLPAAYKNWDALLTDAVRKAMEAGKAPTDVTGWAYGSWHVVDIEHPLAAFLPVVGTVAGTGAQPLSGDTTTVKQVGRAFGPSQRFTMDWSDVDGSTENIVLGESGNPYSAYFRDQWDAYYGGTTFALPFTPAAVGAQTRHTLRLAP